MITQWHFFSNFAASPHPSTTETIDVEINACVSGTPIILLFTPLVIPVPHRPSSQTPITLKLRFCTATTSFSLITPLLHPFTAPQIYPTLPNTSGPSQRWSKKPKLRRTTKKYVDTLMGKHLNPTHCR
jgi:hypothetical protein